MNKDIMKFIKIGSPAIYLWMMAGFAYGQGHLPKLWIISIGWLACSWFCFTFKIIKGPDKFTNAITRQDSNGDILVRIYKDQQPEFPEDDDDPQWDGPWYVYKKSQSSARKLLNSFILILSILLKGAILYFALAMLVANFEELAIDINKILFGNLGFSLFSDKIGYENYE